MDNNFDDVQDAEHSVSVTFVSDMNKFLPANQVLYIDETTFFYVALLTHLCIVAGALCIKDIVTIFDFIGAFCVTFILFFFPSVIFLMTMSKYGKLRHRNSTEFIFYTVMSYAMILTGIATLAIELYANVQNLMDDAAATEAY